MHRVESGVDVRNCRVEERKSRRIERRDLRRRTVAREVDFEKRIVVDFELVAVAKIVYIAVAVDIVAEGSGKTVGRITPR